MSPFDIPTLPARRPHGYANDVRDWVDAYTIPAHGTGTILSPRHDVKDWTLTRLRLCTIEVAMGGLILRVNKNVKLVVPLVAIANGAWFTLAVPIMLAGDDTVTVESSVDVTVALSGLYLLPVEPKP